MTPNSSVTAYLQPTDVLARTDWRVVAQLCNDNPGTATNPNVITYDELLANTNFLTAINSACGMLESACLRSEIYAVTDLQSLNGVSQQYMFTLLTNIIIYMLYSRRSGPAMSESIINNYNFAMKELDDLADGTRIFAFQQTESAGLPITYAQQPYDYAVNQNLVTVKYGRVFGIRNDLTRNGW